MDAWEQYEALRKSVREWSLTTDCRGVPLELSPHYRDMRWGYDARTVFGPDCKPGAGIKGLSYVYSDRLEQWDNQKADRAWQAAIDSGATLKSADFIQAYLSAYYDRLLIVDHILSGVNVSNGYPYWVAGYREANP